MTKINWTAFDVDTRKMTVQAEGLDLNVYLHEEGRVYYMTDGDRDYSPEDQTLSGIFLKVAGEFISFKQIADAAENDFDKLVEEAETEHGYEAAHYAEISDLVGMGRI